MKPEICIPTTGRTLAEITGEALKIAQAAPDLIEFRADYFKDAVFDNIFAAISAIRRANPKTPIIFTFRSKKEGGVSHTPKKTRARILKAVINGRLCQICDIEQSLGTNTVSSLTARAKQKGVLTIISYHNFTRTPNLKKIAALWQNAARYNPDYIKIAAMAKRGADAALLWHAISALSRKSRIKPVVVAMGEEGKITRAAGTAITFAPLFAKGAPGQIPYFNLKEIFSLLYGGNN